MKINIKKIFFISICFFFLFSETKAQSFNSNVANEKYWYYRNRLMYFVKPGLNQGDSNVARDRNNELQTTTIY
jgi:hypothetical protein